MAHSKSALTKEIGQQILSLLPRDGADVYTIRRLIGEKPKTTIWDALDMLIMECEIEPVHPAKRHDGTRGRPRTIFKRVNHGKQ